MDRVNDNELLSLTDKNVENVFRKAEEEESVTEEMEVEDSEPIAKSEMEDGVKAASEENRAKMRTNLEILLTQNDILPLLKKIRKENGRNKQNISLKKYMSHGEKSSKVFKSFFISQKSYQMEGRNARMMNVENENVSSDSEDDLEFVKIEEQPENLKNGVLKEYQMESLNWLLKLHATGVNGILADEMGLGKTIQSISLLAYMQLQKESQKIPMCHIIIVPKVTINNWLREISKWLPSIKVLFFYGCKEERRTLVDSLKGKDFDVILTTFECAMIEKSSLGKVDFEYLIIDEAHRIKNEKAKFSSVVRQFKAKHRLLLTGTPLQNNLHELWALLNFLMPEIFNDSEEFDRVFDLDTASEEDQQKIVKQIHQILRPFVLRRLKSEVEVKLPSKKEIYLYVGLSELQKNMYKQILTKNIDMVNGVSKDKIQLLNILMQLKKVCNHPYLFPKVEKGPPFIEGDHLINNAMKLKILDVLLKKIKNENGRVLIFSQMTTLLNILDDFCRYRNYSYCRIDGSTSSEDRDTRIEQFQAPQSDKFIFLLSTRAGGLGINLHAANSVIIYDSDWNPQVDLQAIDRAHRIGQTRPVTVYRFVTEGTVEEKIIERAAKKLKIDHLIIQRGKSVQSQNKVSALEMTNIIQYGVDKLFSNGYEETTDKDIEEILNYSIDKTEKVQDCVKNIEDKLNINNLSLSNNSKNIYQFEGEDYKKKNSEESTQNAKLFVNLSFSLGQRERKVINSNLEFKKPEFKKIKPQSAWRMKIGGGYSHQFFDNETLDYLEEKENCWLKAREENSEAVEEFTADDEAYREELLGKGFPKWNKKDFTKFLRACEICGLNDYENISKSMRSKTPTDVEEYVRVFKDRVEDLPGGQRIMVKIDKFESEKNKIMEYHSILDTLFSELSQSYEDIYANLKIPYKTKTKQKLELFTETEDKYLVCLMFKYGYRNWNLIRNHMLNDPNLKFNFNIKVKTDQELLDRANFLISCFKLEMSKRKVTKKTEVKGKSKKSKKLSKKKKKMKKSK